MSEILDFGCGMPAFQAALVDWLPAGRSHPVSGAFIEKPESSQLAFAVEVSTWKMLK